MESLHVNSVLFGNATLNRRFIKLLACAELLDYAGFFKLSLKLLQCSFDVLTIFYWYYNHTFCFYFLVIIFRYPNCGRKITHSFDSRQIFLINFSLKVKGLMACAPPFPPLLRRIFHILFPAVPLRAVFHARQAPPYPSPGLPTPSLPAMLLLFHYLIISCIP